MDFMRRFATRVTVLHQGKVLRRHGGRGAGRPQGAGGLPRPQRGRGAARRTESTDMLETHRHRGRLRAHAGAARRDGAGREGRGRARPQRRRQDDAAACRDRAHQASGRVVLSTAKTSRRSPQQARRSRHGVRAAGSAGVRPAHHARESAARRRRAPGRQAIDAQLARFPALEVRSRGGQACSRAGSASSSRSPAPSSPSRSCSSSTSRPRASSPRSSPRSSTPSCSWPARGSIGAARRAAHRLRVALDRLVLRARVRPDIFHRRGRREVPRRGSCRDGGLTVHTHERRR